ncbi:hypothetical protein HK102_007719, partial [Quaeritorhiza haematococci]
MTVSETLDAPSRKGGIDLDLVEIRVPMTQHMKDIQAAIVECLAACVSELKRANSSVSDVPFYISQIDIDDFTVENALFRSFDTIVRVQLEPIWYRVSNKTKQLVGDLKVLRKLLSYLVSYDCVTFNSFLETILSSSTVAATSLSAAQRALHSGADVSPWLFMDAAHTIFQGSRLRVYKRIASDSGTNGSGSGTGTTANGGNAASGESSGEDWDTNIYLQNKIPPNLEPVLEEQPKWRVLVDILREIEIERKQLMEENAAALEAAGDDDPDGDVRPPLHYIGPVLIMVDGDRTAQQLREIISGCDLTVVKPEMMEEEDEYAPPPAPSRGRGFEDAENDLDGDDDASTLRNKNSRKRKRRAKSANPRHRQHLPHPQMTPVTKFSTPGSKNLLSRLLGNYFHWKAGMSKVTHSLFKRNIKINKGPTPATSSSSKSSSSSSSYSASSRGGAGGSGGAGAGVPSFKRRR